MLSILKGHIVETKTFGQLTVTENGYLVLENGVIQGVFPVLPACYEGVPVTDYGDRLILQAFSDMHLHAPQFPMLGMGMDLPLLDWLTAYTYPVEAAFADAELARTIYRQLVRTLVDNGTTRVCIFSSVHREATLALMEELEKAGVSGYAGKVNMDRNSSPLVEETTEESKRETLRWLDECAGFTKVKPILTPRFTPTCTNELMAWLGDLARERGLYVQSHLSENKAEMEWVKRLHPDCAQYWESYAKYGLFNDHTVMAHCVHSDEREQLAMRDHGVFVAHCPDSNINICSGFSPIMDMVERGLQVGLGSDIAGGAHLPMNQVMQAAIRTSKTRRINSVWEQPFLKVSEAYYLATSAGAAYFGDKPGFGAGNRLHAIVADDSRFPMVRSLTVQERFERLIYMAKPTDYIAVYGAGEKIK